MTEARIPYGDRSACGRTSAPPANGLVVRVAECSRPHRDPHFGVYWHAVSFTDDPQWVTCLACRRAANDTP